MSRFLTLTVVNSGSKIITSIYGWGVPLEHLYYYYPSNGSTYLNIELGRWSFGHSWWYWTGKIIGSALNLTLNWILWQLIKSSKLAWICDSYELFSKSSHSEYLPRNISIFSMLPHSGPMWFTQQSWEGGFGYCPVSARPTDLEAVPIEAAYGLGNH